MSIIKKDNFDPAQMRSNKKLRNIANKQRDLEL